jgi:hypothetical protein
MHTSRSPTASPYVSQTVCCNAAQTADASLLQGGVVYFLFNDALPLPVFSLFQLDTFTQLYLSKARRFLQITCKSLPNFGFKLIFVLHPNLFYFPQLNSHHEILRQNPSLPHWLHVSPDCFIYDVVCWRLSRVLRHLRHKLYPSRREACIIIDR